MKRTHRKGLATLAVAGMAMSAVSAAFAFQPTGQESYEISIPTFAGKYETAGSQQASNAVSHALGSQYGGQWSVHTWNPATQTPSQIIGTGAVVAAGLANDFDVEEAARQVAVDNAGVLGLNPEQLELHKVTRGLGKAAGHFKQVWEGYEVMGGRYHSTFLEETGRVFVMSSDFYSGIDLDPVPAVSESEAIEIAKAGVDFDPTEDRIEGDVEIKVLPITPKVDQVEYHLVYIVNVQTMNPLGEWISHVDAHTGEIVYRYNDVHFYSGTTVGDVQFSTYCNGETDNDPMAYMDVTVSGQGTTTSDENGEWSIGPNSGSATVTAQFFGPYCNVNRASGGSDAQFNGTADGATPFEIEWNDANSRQDERDVFDSVSDVHDFIETIDPGFGYSNVRINANVGVSGTCNAFWNGTINFYNAGGGCANTGEIAGVVHHEFGHGVQDFILGFQGNQGLGEGNADILANFITDESIIGRGFFSGNCSSGIRNSDNNLVYPDDLTGQVHSDGTVLAGAVWAVRGNLEASLGAAAGEFRCAELWHFGRTLEQPTNQPNQILSMFIADDDDGNLGNGTPNYAAICDAVTPRGHDCPLIIEGVFITHTPPASPATPGPTAIVADVETTIGGADIVDATVVLSYTVNDGPATNVVMSPDGGPTYSAMVDVPDNSEVAYFISAQDTEGNEGTSPLNAPVNRHTVDTPTVYDDIEADAGWTVNPDGTDDATTGAWERADPQSTSSQPGDDHTPDPGVNCWITEAAAGSGDGSFDIDNGTTTLQSVAYDLTGASRAKVKYFRWYSNDQGADPNNDIWIVQARNDGGSWVDIENTQGNQNTWFEVSADLIALFPTPGMVEFRFIASDLSDGSLVEAGVDDFSLFFEGSSADAPELDGAAKFAFYGARPNPIAGSGSIAFQVPNRSDVRISVYDVSGRQVRALANENFSAGIHNVEFDGKDDRGNHLGSGVYFVRMNAGEYEGTRSITVK